MRPRRHSRGRERERPDFPSDLRSLTAARSGRCLHGQSHVQAPGHPRRRGWLGWAEVPVRCWPAAAGRRSSSGSAQQGLGFASPRTIRALVGTGAWCVRRSPHHGLGRPTRSRSPAPGWREAARRPSGACWGRVRAQAAAAPRTAIGGCAGPPVRDWCGPWRHVH
jgi:hypothetical protein